MHHTSLSSQVFSKASIFKFVSAITAVSSYFLITSLSLNAMTLEAKQLLALLVSAVILWITMPIPIYLTGLLIPVIAWVIGISDFNTAFSGFSGTTFWFLFATLGMAGCIRESGIARRIALLLLKRIKPRFSSLILIIEAIMFVLGYILPLAAARVALMLAIVIPLVTLFDVQIKSNLSKAVTMTVAMLGYASGWQVLTGGMPTMLLWGTLAQAGYQVTWVEWALIMFVPTLLVFVVMYFVITRLFKPDRDEISGGMNKIKVEIVTMGKLTPVEKKAAAILTLIIILWLTQPLHHLGVELVGIAGVFLFVLPGIGTINFEDFMKKAVPWSQLIFIGALMSLVVMTSATGLNKYIGDLLVVPVYSFASNQVLFVVATWLLNTVTGAFSLFVPSIALLTPAIAGAAAVSGVNPVVGTLIYLSCFPQMLFYATVPFFPLAYDTGAISTWDWVKAGFFYWLIWPIAHLVCLYTWYPLLSAIGILH